MESALIQTSETLSHRFLMLIQALSGISGLTTLDIEELSETKLLDHVMDVLIQNLDLDKCSIFLLEGEELYCAIGRGWDEYTGDCKKDPNRQFHTFRLGEGAVGIAARNKRLYHCHNCRLDKNYIPIINSNANRNSGSLISAPIMMGRR